MAEDRADRLLSLDVLRGADMFLLTVIGPLVWALDGAFGLPDAVLFQFTHPWEGFTLWDIIMPLFLFMCGAAIPLSLERRIARNGGRADASYFYIVTEFVHDEIDVEILEELLMLGGLGIQYCIKSPRAFAALSKVDGYPRPVSYQDYNSRYNERDRQARDRMDELISGPANKALRVMSTLVENET